MLVRTARLVLRSALLIARSQRLLDRVLVCASGLSVDGTGKEVRRSLTSVSQPLVTWSIATVVQNVVKSMRRSWRDLEGDAGASAGEAGGGDNADD